MLTEMIYVALYLLIALVGVGASLIGIGFLVEKIEEIKINRSIIWSSYCIIKEERDSLRETVNGFENNQTNIDSPVYIILSNDEGIKKIIEDELSKMNSVFIKDEKSAMTIVEKINNKCIEKKIMPLCYYKKTTLEEIYYKELNAPKEFMRGL